ncbi:hypothetical protein NDU88_003104 [Pleurodeles waltl]|uniref:Uncharacterized protein n=1 Tax=Pleurodeles waltl TaxID=8319 RepID=A0AAV7T590_PLEWA|nr:hypothetical protein NDU88_003104 [Pleurodeles waltl]
MEPSKFRFFSMEKKFMTPDFGMALDLGAVGREELSLLRSILLDCLWSTSHATAEVNSERVVCPTRGSFCEEEEPSDMWL